MSTSPPESATSELVIRADGVFAKGTPAGTVIGGDWQRPEPIYGPFDWEVLSGKGELTVGSTTDYYGTEVNCAWFEPSEPGTSIIRATTKDGTKSVNFAVVSEPVLAEKLTLEQKELTLTVGESAAVKATLSPEPSLEKHADVKWQSFDPSVAAVDPETGVITAVSEGYAYIRAYTDVQQTLETVCIVHVVPAEMDFVDVSEGDWFYEAVEYVVSRGIMNGLDDTHFGPGGVTNRAQVVTVLYRMAGAPAVEGQMPFVDVAEGAWFHDAVLWAYQNGIAQGMDATHFAPGDNINRAQLVTFLYRFAKPEGQVDTSILERFPDGAGLPDFCRDSFAWAIDTGLIAGMDGMLNAGGSAIRAQLATVLMRFDSMVE